MLACMTACFGPCLWLNARFTHHCVVFRASHMPAVSPILGIGRDWSLSIGRRAALITDSTYQYADMLRLTYVRS